MNRIAIIGNPGAGKSTLANELGEIYNLPVTHLDKYYLDELTKYYEEENRDAWQQKATSFAEEEKWVIDGNYSSSLEQRIVRADQVIHLEFSTISSLAGVLRRRIKYNTTARPDAPDNWEEKLNQNFIKYVVDYNKRHKQKYTSLLNEDNAHKLLVLRSRKEIKNYLKDLKKSR